MNVQLQATDVIGDKARSVLCYQRVRCIVPVCGFQRQHSSKTHEQSVEGLPRRLSERAKSEMYVHGIIEAMLNCSGLITFASTRESVYGRAEHTEKQLGQKRS